MTPDKVTFEEVRANGWTVVGEDVYDLAPFAARHPGGSAVLSALRGREATLQVVNAHGVQGALPKLPPKWRVGIIDEATLSPVDRDLRALLERFRREGLFTYERAWLASDIAIAVLGAAFGILLIALGAPAAGVPILALTQLHVMWWVHDASHNAVFRTEKHAKRWSELASIVFVGTPVLRYQYVVHRAHHALTNVIGGDHALETGVVVWDARMRGRTRPWIVAIQPWLWFGVFLPLAFAAFLVTAAIDGARRREYRSLAWTALRWAVVLVALGPSITGYVVVATSMAGYALALVSSLNHFHLPMSDAATHPHPRFADSVSKVTQNLRYTSPLATWLFGGLNLHVEHHLFATMPRQRYPEIAPHVRALFARHGLSYRECGIAASLGALVRQLRDPFGNGEDAALDQATATS